jgi:hypothetical protein
VLEKKIKYSVRNSEEWSKITIARNPVSEDNSNKNKFPYACNKSKTNNTPCFQRTLVCRKRSKERMEGSYISILKRIQ